MNKAQGLLALYKDSINFIAHVKKSGHILITAFRLSFG